MKFLVAVLSFVGFVAGQEGQTVTEGLLASQDDLGHSHLFFEVSLFQNRDETSAYMYRIQREVIKSHMNSYEFIKTTALEARDEIEAIERTELNEQCLDDVINRWTLQYTR
jgi:hypothetical protein